MDECRAESSQALALSMTVWIRNNTIGVDSLIRLQTNPTRGRLYFYSYCVASDQAAVSLAS